MPDGDVQVALFIPQGTDPRFVSHEVMFSISRLCVHGFPMSGKGRKEEEKALARSAELGREGPLRPHPRAGLIAKQNWGRGLPCLSIVMVQDS